jgi:hypothetical protein
MRVAVVAVGMLRQVVLVAQVVVVQVVLLRTVQLAQQIRAVAAVGVGLL